MKPNSEEVGALNYARRRALPVYGPDNPRRAKLIQALKMGRRTAPKALNDSARGCGDERGKPRVSDGAETSDVGGNAAERPF